MLERRLLRLLVEDILVEDIGDDFLYRSFLGFSLLADLFGLFVGVETDFDADSLGDDFGVGIGVGLLLLALLFFG